MPMQILNHAADPTLTQGSVLFVGASGVLSQDNANLSWDDTDDTLTIGSGTSQLIFNQWAAVRQEILQGSTGTPSAVAGPTVKISRTQQIDVDTLGGNKDDIEGTAALSAIALGTATDEVLACGVHGGASTASTVTGIDAFGVMARGRVTGSGVGIGGGGYFVGRRDTTTGKANGIEVRSWNYTTTAGLYNTTGISNTIGVWITSDGIAATPFDSGCGIALGGLNGTKFKVGYGAVAGSVADSTFRDDSSSTTSIDLRGTHTTGVLLQGTYTNALTIIAACSGSAINVSTSAVCTDPGSGGVALSPTVRASANRVAVNSQPALVPTAAALTLTGLQFIPKVLPDDVTSNALSAVHGILTRVDADATYAGTITTVNGLRIITGTVGGATYTNQYGINIGPITTAGTLNVGIRVDAASTQTLWVSGDANNTTAAAGIAFGSSRDTNLYRSAADTLKTDDSLVVVGSVTSPRLTITATAGDVGTPAAGEHWYNSTQAAHRFQNAAGTLGQVGLIYASTADDALASGGTSELKFASQIALVAAGLTVGKVIRVRLRGTYTTDATASQTAVINIKLGDATNATSGTTVATTRFALTSGLTNANWDLEVDIVIRSATTAWGAGSGSVGSTVAAPWTAAVVSVSNGGGVGTVTTIPNISGVHTVHVTGTPNDTGCTLTLRTMTVEILN